MNNPFRKTLLQQYVEAKQKRVFWETKERELRKELADDLLPYNGKAEKRIVSEGDLLVKVERQHRYSVIKDADFSELSKAEHDCFSWSPRLLLKNYRALPDKSAIDELITVHESPPTITILEDA